MRKLIILTTILILVILYVLLLLYEFVYFIINEFTFITNKEIYVKVPGKIRFGIL